MIRIPIWVAVALAVTIPTIIWAGDVVIPHVFQPETTIKAAEVNANFEALRAAAAGPNRIVVNGGGIIIETRTDPGTGETFYFYATPLPHPLLDNNPSAVISVTKDITSHSPPTNCSRYVPDESSVYYEGGRWLIKWTCPSIKYHVFFWGTRTDP